MQLNDKNNKRAIGAALSAATYGLLMGTTPGQAEDAVAATATAADASDKPWRVDAGAMYYTEEDRIDVRSYVVDTRRRIGEEEFVTAKLVYDSITGASPTGATYVQTSTSSSGSAPMGNFAETRKAIAATWERPVADLTRMNLGVNHSRSDTYESVGASAVFSSDFNQRNTTVTYGVGYARDKNQPHGGVPEPLDEVGSADIIKSEGIKRQTDLQLGVTQVLGRATLAQINYVRSNAEGYLTNPYKVVSVVHPLTGETLSFPTLHEKRPDERRSNALLGQINHQFGVGIGYATYRYYWDDWDVRAHTLELKYRLPLNERAYLQGLVRNYTQTAAEFFHPVVLSNQVPEYASADYRLSDLQTISAGLKFGYRTDEWGEATVRYEYILQTGEEHPSGTVGVQREAELFPDLTAHVIHIGYTVDF